jgi:amicyanin
MGAGSPNAAASPAQDGSATPSTISLSLVSVDTSTTPVAARRVTIAGFAFAPPTITVRVGTAITWTNNDAAGHTVTSDRAGPLRSPVLPRGGKYSFTFTRTGTYSYHCQLHPFMHGTVIVR